MSFRFHYFSYENKYKKPFSARNLIANMNSRYNETNYNHNKEDININTIRSMQLSHDISSNKKIKSIILTKNIKKELNFNTLKEILPLMLEYNNYLPDDTKILDEKMNNNDIECSNIISCFQLLIKYLFEKKEENEKFNQILENKISSLKDDFNSNKLSELIQKNNIAINKLQQRKMKLITFLKNNGKNVPSEKNKKIYICNLCPLETNKFNSYKAFHKHYVKYHINPYSFYNSNNNKNITMYNSLGLDSDYLELKINNVLQKVKTAMMKSKSQIKGGKGKNINKDNLASDTRMLASERLYKGSQINKKKYDEIKKRIERLENNQKNFENMFKMKVDDFLEEFKIELEKLKGQ